MQSTGNPNGRFYDRGPVDRQVISDPQQLVSAPYKMGYFGLFWIRFLQVFFRALLQSFSTSFRASFPYQIECLSRVFLLCFQKHFLEIFTFKSIMFSQTSFLTYKDPYRMDIVMKAQACVRKQDRSGSEKLKEILLKKIKINTLDILSF